MGQANLQAMMEWIQPSPGFLAAVVAVASGTTSAARLHAAGADVVLDDLADTGRLLVAINEAWAAAAAR